MAMYRFYWLLPGRLAGCSRPGALFTPDGDRADDENLELARLRDDLEWLRRQGIGAVLTLTESPLPPEVLGEHALETLHLAVPDMHAPQPGQFAAALTFIDTQLVAGRPVAVHCLAGQGRTGTILAAYLIRSGFAAADAVEQVRDICPGAIESREQREALASFGSRRDWVV
ncbi:MAG TPA: dual specificity protein phosphatase family protein [Thermomicrobiaceae bacterium]|nr:dual specificity protein phosphatase family protein [Thermomicrobiaceae bacterium]